MWVIASIPFWIIGSLFALGACASIEWREQTTNQEVTRVFGGILLSGIFFLIAARIAS